MLNAHCTMIVICPRKSPPTVIIQLSPNILKQWSLLNSLVYCMVAVFRLCPIMLSIVINRKSYWIRLTGCSLCVFAYCSSYEWVILCFCWLFVAMLCALIATCMYVLLFTVKHILLYWRAWPLSIAMSICKVQCNNTVLIHLSINSMYIAVLLVLQLFNAQHSLGTEQAAVLSIKY